MPLQLLILHVRSSILPSTVEKKTARYIVSNRSIFFSFLFTIRHEHWHVHVSQWDPDYIIRCILLEIICTFQSSFERATKHAAYTTNVSLCVCVSRTDEIVENWKRHKWNDWMWLRSCLSVWVEYSYIRLAFGSKLRFVQLAYHLMPHLRTARITCSFKSTFGIPFFHPCYFFKRKNTRNFHRL